MPARTSLVVPCLISVPISDLTASGNGNLTASNNGNLTVFGPSVAAARSYTSPIYIALDF